MKTRLIFLLILLCCVFFQVGCNDEYSTEIRTGNLQLNGDVIMSVQFSITQYKISGRVVSNDLAASVNLTSTATISNICLYFDDSLLAQATNLPMSKEFFRHAIAIGDTIAHIFKVTYLFDGQEYTDSLRTAFVADFPTDTTPDNPSFSGRSDSASHTIRMSEDSLRFSMWFEYGGSRLEGFTGHAALRITGNSSIYKITTARFELDNSLLSPVLHNDDGLSPGMYMTDDTTISEGTHLIKGTVFYIDDNGIPRTYFATITFKIGEQEPAEVRGTMVGTPTVIYETNNAYIRVEPSFEYTGNLHDGFTIIPTLRVHGSGYPQSDTQSITLVVDGRLFQKSFIRTDTFDYNFRFPSMFAEAGMHYYYLNCSGHGPLSNDVNWFALYSTREACWEVDTSYFFSYRMLNDGTVTDSIYMHAELTGNTCTGKTLKFTTHYAIDDHQNEYFSNCALIIDHDTIYTFGTIPSLPENRTFDVSHLSRGIHYMQFIFTITSMDGSSTTYRIGHNTFI